VTGRAPAAPSFVCVFCCVCVLVAAAAHKLEAFRRGAVDRVTVRTHCLRPRAKPCWCFSVCAGGGMQAAMALHRAAVEVQVQGCNVLKTLTFKQGASRGLVRALRTWGRGDACKEMSV
jgi:hypothetical protein